MTGWRIPEAPPVVLAGLQGIAGFRTAILEATGTLDAARIEAGIVEVARQVRSVVRRPPFQGFM